jgi:uncharacterized membrane protein
VIATVTFRHEPTWPFSLPTVGVRTFVVVAILLVILTAWTYWGNQRVRRLKFATILGLRLFALVLAFLMVLRPSLAFRDDAKTPSTLLLAIDHSESMTIPDEFDSQQRWQLLQRTLAENESAFQRLREEQNVTILPYAFAGQVVDYDPKMKADGKRTDFGQMLRTLYEKHGRERNLRALLVFSDGADNGVVYPALREAANWSSIKCPIETFALGRPDTAGNQKDVAFTAIHVAPSPVPVKTKMKVKGLLDAHGFENAQVKVHLLLDDKPPPPPAESVKPVTLRLRENNEVEFELDAPSTPGEIKVTLKIDHLRDDLSPANDEISTFATITKEGVSVLLVDYHFGEPQAICDALRGDPRFRLDFDFRVSNAPGPGASLFEPDRPPYDVVIIGDVTARRFEAGNPKVLEQVKDQVLNRGMGLLMYGGLDTFGNADWPGTPVADVLPVDLSERGQNDVPMRLEPTAKGLAHFVLKLRDNEAETKELFSKLPELAGRTRIGKPKPGASVLAVRAGTDEPLLVVYPQIGKGRSAALAVDTTWLWKSYGQPKSREGIEAHKRFWKQLILFLAQQDQADGNAWVRPEARRLPAGSKVAFAVGLKGKGGVDLKDARFDVTAVGPDGVESPVTTVKEEAEERGIYWKTDQPGEYKLVVKAKGKDVDGQEIDGTSSARFLVYHDDAETTRRAADHKFLAELAEKSGGRFRSAKELGQYLKELAGKPLPQAQPRAELWPDWRRSSLSGFHVSFFLLYACVLCLEWFLRRLWGLV